MKRIILLVAVVLPSLLYSQWTVCSGINNGRNDDITFLNDSVGYVAGGNNKNIYQTNDGGNTWSAVHTGGTYLRSIKFIDEAIGFCGSLDSVFLMTVDSGQTWTNITSTIPTQPKGICGISIPNDSVIYGVGIYNQPAFLIRSFNRGMTWNYINMDTLLSAIVEVNFISQDTGWVCGRANPSSDGGEILYTTNGGVSWTSVFKTNRNLDYVWKIQSPDKQNYYASVSSTPSANGTYFLKSIDNGLTWTEMLVDSTWTDIQMIGFIDSLRGWTGGANDLFETIDGGITWIKKNNIIPFGGYYNRFVKRNDSTAFISGIRVYKFSDTSSVVTSISKIEKRGEIHQLEVYPNPTSKLNFTITIGNRTHAVIQLINLKGELVENFFDGFISEGEHRFKSIKEYETNAMFLIMRTNEGLQYEKVVFK